MRVISFGGGVDSTALCLLMLGRGEKVDHIVFADTGAERPETYEHCRTFDSFLKGKYGVGVTTVTGRYGDMYQFMWDKKLIPSRMWPAKHIEKFKITPIAQFLASVRDGQEVEVNLGIDYDEADRQTNRTRYKWIKHRYPLVDDRIGRRGCEKIIRDAGLKIPIKSGCYFCPFQRKAQLLSLRRLHPGLFDKARALEENCSRDLTIFYGGPLKDIDREVSGQLTLDQVCSTAYCMR